MKVKRGLFHFSFIGLFHEEHVKYVNVLIKAYFPIALNLVQILDCETVELESRKHGNN